MADKTSLLERQQELYEKSVEANNKSFAFQQEVQYPLWWGVRSVDLCVP